MDLYVALTDLDWFQFLASRPDLDELNFWTPRPWGGEFRVLQPLSPNSGEEPADFGETPRLPRGTS